MSDKRYERRGQEFADTLHERARTATAEYCNLLTAFAVGSLALFFLTVTEKIEPPLTSAQLWTLCFAIGLMATATFAGVYQWYSDAQRNYYWAKVEEGKQTSGGAEFDTLSVVWKRRRYKSIWLLRACFLCGIGFAVAYIVERLFAV